jgi:hypothetical protein
MKMFLRRMPLWEELMTSSLIRRRRNVLNLQLHTPLHKIEKNISIHQWERMPASVWGLKLVILQLSLGKIFTLITLNWIIPLKWQMFLDRYMQLITSKYINPRPGIYRISLNIYLVSIQVNKFLTSVFFIKYYLYNY